ncbi:universal stress protein [Streptomyces sp. 900105755]|uniref:universal stress protein n=1 Tax=Streptomyces sp. Ag109_O5-10 TaxID=1855349 RepID=UPI00089C09C3|nr:universal stress protein [Streptomyces sp. Ag109_O5-10]SEF17570.1 Nucleotide-binding universal stress protein, UspA family [Streptomyces sp. Ag109_O5-10]
MTGNVTAGVDGSPESRAAADWAAHEARLRTLPLKILHVCEPVPGDRAPRSGAESERDRYEWDPAEAAAGLRLRHPGVEVCTDRVTGDPATALAEAADAAELLALGSRGLGGLGGFLVGSVSLYVVAHAARPVVLVRAEGQAAGDHLTAPAGGPSATAPSRPVVVGLDTRDPDATLLEFAFDAAARRGAVLRVVHGWTEPPGDFRRFHGVELHAALARQQATALTDALHPWRRKFPSVDVIEASRCGSAAQVLVNASRDASLTVVGRRIRTSPVGTRIGHVTHAVLHHVVAPVAVVAHGG